MWGNAQTQVLAAAGKVLGNRTFVASAEREATGFYPRLLIHGFLKEWDLASAGPPSRYEQIAYAVRPMAVGLIRLFEATGKNDYLVMAGLAGSWLCGNNVLGQQVYDPVTGRCFDGIRDSVTINRNSGAESTIEALYALLEIEQYPVARRFLSYRKISSGKMGEYDSALFKDAQGEEATLRLNRRDGTVTILEGEASRRFQEEHP
jgi:hypothetical protein